MIGTFPSLSSYALRFCLPFASTCMCESVFACVLYIKSKQKKFLTVESHTCSAILSTTPNIEKLVSDKRIQKVGCKEKWVNQILNLKEKSLLVVFFA